MSSEGHQCPPAFLAGAAATVMPAALASSATVFSSCAILCASLSTVPEPPGPVYPPDARLRFCSSWMAEAICRGRGGWVRACAVS